MGNKCFKSKAASRGHDDDVPNNKRAKKAGKYALDGQANQGFAQEASSRQSAGDDGGGGEFTDLSAVTTDSGGRIIHVPGSDQVRIELANGPNHERPIDVPGDQGQTRVQVSNHGNAGGTPDTAVRPNGAMDMVVDMDNTPKMQKDKDNSKLKTEENNVKLKDRSDSSSSESSRENSPMQSRDDFAHRFAEHPLAESGGFSNPALELSDSECKSLSDASADDTHIDLQFIEGKTTADTTAHLPVQNMDAGYTPSQRPDSLDRDTHAREQSDSESDKESDKVSRSSDEEENNMRFHDIMHGSKFTHEVTHKQFELQHHEPQFEAQLREPSARHSPVEMDETDHVVIGSNSDAVAAVEPAVTQDHFQLRRRADSSASSASHKSAKSDKSADTAQSVKSTKSDKSAKSHSSKSSRSSSDASEKLDSVINVADKHETEVLEKELGRGQLVTEEDEAYVATPSPFGSLFPAFHFKNDGQGLEADREIGEIILEIERIEEHLAGELAGDQEAEELSRHIVEKLDEITALREQAEVMFDNDVISELDLDDDVGCFKDTGEVMQWYNMSMDEVNEAVGMALLELSMIEACDVTHIREQLSYHRDAQSDLLRKKTQLKRAVSMRDQTVVQQQGRDISAVFNYEPVEVLGDGHLPSLSGKDRVELDLSDQKLEFVDKPERDSPYQFDLIQHTKRDSPVEQYEHAQNLDRNSPELKVEHVSEAERDSPSPVLQGITMQDPSMRLFQDEATLESLTGDERPPVAAVDPFKQEDNALSPLAAANRPALNFMNPAHGDDNVTSLTAEQRPVVNLLQDEEVLELQVTDDRPGQEVRPQVKMDDKFGELESLEFGETKINLQDPFEQSAITSGQYAQTPAQDSEDELVLEDTIKPEVHAKRELNPSEIDLNFSFDPSDFDQKHEPHIDPLIDNQQQNSNEPDLLVGFESRSDRLESPVNQKRKDPDSSSDDNDDTPMGVNQFATPYRLEDDLWTKVESIPANDIHINLNSDLPQGDKPPQLQTETLPHEKDESQTEIHAPVPTRSAVRRHSRSSSSSSSSSSSEDEKEVTEQDIIPHVAKKPESPKMQLEYSDEVAEQEVTTEADVLRGSLKGSMMYGSDSDSDSELEIDPQTKVVPQKTVPVASLMKQKLVFDDDSDIEEKEINYEIVREQNLDISKPESPKPETQLHTRHSESENSDSSVEDIVNYALRLEEGKTQAKIEPIFDSHTELDYAQPYMQFSEQLAKEIVETSSNEAASPRDYMGGLEAELQHAHAQSDFEIQTDTRHTSEQSVQSHTIHHDAHSTQTDTRQYSERAIETDSAEVVSKETSMDTHASIATDISQTDKRVIAPATEIRFDSDSDEGGKSADSDDSDVDGVHREYDVMMSKPITKAKPITGAHSESSSQSGHSGSDSDQERTSDEELHHLEDENENDAEEPENEAVNEQLKETLKDDIIGTIHGLTQGDFTQLLGVYRDQRKQLQHQRDADRGRHQRSLWEILEERKRKTDQHVHGGAEDQHVHGGAEDQHVHGGAEDQSDEEKTGAQANGRSSDDTHSDSDVSSDAADVEEGLLRAEELNQTIQLMDLEIVRQACENNNRDVADDMIRKHFELVEKMRRDKQETLAQHRAKMMAKLETRGQASQLSSSSSSDTCNEENTDMKDEAISHEMDELTGGFLGAIKANREMDEQELYDMLLQYREEQQELIRKREYEKLRIQERLKERLKKRQEQRQEQRMRNSDSSSDEDDKKPEHDVASMDAEFYERMVKRYQSGELDEDQLSAMLDEHLRQVDAFKRNLRGMLANRRTKQRQKPSASMKLREAGALVERKNEEAERIRVLRQAEKDKADRRLQEKMQQKKAAAYDDAPDLPAPIRPARKQQRTTEHAHISMNYENVEYDV